MYSQTYLINMKKVSEESAKALLESLLDNPKYLCDPIGQEIKSVLEGSHKTYKPYFRNTII